LACFGNNGTASGKFSVRTAGGGSFFGALSINSLAFFCSSLLATINCGFIEN
jgi:hypothetical protein